MIKKKFLSSYPKLVKEWHPTKNSDQTPNDFTHGSDKKVWWLCPKGHDYESTISNRTSKRLRGCPYCSGKKVSEENNLLVLFPDIAKEWHPDKNTDLTPKDFTYGSDKKVWWLCSKGHSYDTRISNRTSLNRGCPYCSGRRKIEE